MDILLAITGFGFIILGIIGAFLPIIPGPITSWLGLLLLYITKAIPNNNSFLIITFCVAIGLLILDYVVPAMATKRFGGSKYGVGGSMVGLIIGLGFGPVGIIFGPLVGAFVGELINDSQNKNKAVKAAMGSFIGFLFSTTLKFVLALVYAVFFIQKFWEHKGGFFGME